MVISDYAKGVLTPRVIRAVIARAKKLKKPVVVDPKGIDFSIYRGATVITPNRKELVEATRMPAGDATTRLRRPRPRWAARSRSKAVLVTLSEDGMLLQRARRASRCTCRPIRSKVRDVSGAGDTVAAVLAVHARRWGPISRRRCAPPMPRRRW